MIEREVAAAVQGDKARDGEPEPGPCRTRLVFEVDSADAQLIRDAISRMRAEAALNREEVEDGALLAAIVRRGLEAEQTADAPTAEAWRVVVDLCPGCRQTIVGDATVSDAVAGELACDAEVVNLLPGATQGHISRTIPPSTRRIVLHRNAHRCAVPGCRNRLWLHIHHLRSRACGGGHEPDNLVPCCPAHHRAIHEGVLGLGRDTRGGIVVYRLGTPHVGRPDAGPAPHDSARSERLG